MEAQNQKVVKVCKEHLSGVKISECIACITTKGYCKICAINRTKKWCKENRLKRNIYSNQWSKGNREKRNILQRAHRFNNKDLWCKYHKKHRKNYYERNKQKLLTKIKLYRSNNHNKILSISSRWDKRSREQLADSYLKRLLSQDGIKKEYIVPAMIELRKNSILIKRIIKKLKQENT